MSKDLTLELQNDYVPVDVNQHVIAHAVAPVADGNGAIMRNKFIITLFYFTRSDLDAGRSQAEVIRSLRVGETALRKANPLHVVRDIRSFEINPPNTPYKTSPRQEPLGEVSEEKFTFERQKNGYYRAIDIDGYSIDLLRQLAKLGFSERYAIDNGARDPSNQLPD